MTKILIPLMLLLFPLYLHAQSAEDYYEDGIEAFQKGKYKASIKATDKALAIDAHTWEYYQLKADCYMELEDYYQVLQTYNKGIEENPQSYHLHNNRGNFYYLAHKFRAADRDFTKALEYASTDSMKVRAYINRAAVYLATREWQDAKDDLLIAYDMDSNSTGVLNNLANATDELGDTEKAIEYLERALEIDSTQFETYTNIGFLYQQLERYEEAIKYFDKTLEVSKDNPYGYSNRAYNKYKLGDIKGAMTDINKSIKFFPENSYAHKVRALILIEQGKRDQACEELDEALRLGYLEMYGDEATLLKEEHCY
ncbi:MAG: tetratricopeptide repeat protein [Bacteroidia bacterium]